MSSSILSLEQKQLNQRKFLKVLIEFCKTKKMAIEMLFAEYSDKETNTINGTKCYEFLKSSFLKTEYTFRLNEKEKEDFFEKKDGY